MKYEIIDEIKVEGVKYKNHQKNIKKFIEILVPICDKKRQKLILKQKQILAREKGSIKFNLLINIKINTSEKDIISQRESFKEKVCITMEILNVRRLSEK
ncbi:hypothetical protein [Halonatronum saccharophilum]|uniref:hypothetical protein n=1 Tax=Halonatronum saccharophilum TaxID=150060 RepID=UPI0004837E1F|nr:hypothetical protein [Halonatronum saccharophilum]